MIGKVLVAEDFDSVSIAVTKTLEELQISELHHSKYCDDALLKIKKALFEKAPFDLLITDLSFLEDGRQSRINTGEMLIAEVRRIQPELKILVFSVEDKPFKIKSLFDNYGIAGYIFKGRNSIPQLKQAISELEKGGKPYLSPELSNIRSSNGVSEIDEYDITLLKYLALGLTQNEISAKFQQTGISPSSRSAVEKRINRLKIHFMANNSVQIVVMAKDLGFI
ncbi:MAG: response regulator transcription factor [Flavobacterium sp.]|nr:MAG: response regulator transcription factor [Flavobacterium sp.]